MKKSNAQAETPSQPGELLRTSRPRTEVFEQKHTASSVVRYVFHDHFFYFYLDYKHKHTATGVASHVSHVRFFLFF